jgi:hypothetical protein
VSTISEQIDAETVLRVVNATTSFNNPQQVNPVTALPPLIAAKLADMRSGLDVTEIMHEEVQAFVVTTVCRRGDGSLDSFTALNVETQKLWHFIGHMVAEPDLPLVRPNAKFWEISALQTERCGSRVRSVVLLWEP